MFKNMTEEVLNLAVPVTTCMRLYYHLWQKKKLTYTGNAILTWRKRYDCVSHVKTEWILFWKFLMTKFFSDCCQWLDYFSGIFCKPNFKLTRQFSEQSVDRTPIVVISGCTALFCYRRRTDVDAWATEMLLGPTASGRHLNPLLTCTHTKSCTLTAKCELRAPFPSTRVTWFLFNLAHTLKKNISHTQKEALIPCYAPDRSVSAHGLCDRQPHWSTWWPWVCHRGTLIIAL